MSDNDDVTEPQAPTSISFPIGGGTAEPQTPSPISSLAGIEKVVVGLGSAVQDLIYRQAKSVRRARRLAIIALIGLVLDITLTITGVFLYITALDNSHRISDQQKVLSTIQKRFALEGICPIYDIILTGYNPKSPNALANPKFYDAQFTRYEKSAKALGCPHTTRGPKPK